MKAVQLTAIRRLEIAELPKPQIENDDEVLVRVKAVGVCGSDVHYYAQGRIGTNKVQFPYRIGHECSGIVEQTGSKVTRVKVGDEVTVNPAQSCGRCEQCRMGRENTCRNLKFLGTPGEGPGCLCEYIIMPQSSLFDVTGKMTLETAVLCEPFTIGLYAVQQAGIKNGNTVAIFGAGPIGLSCMVAAKTAGAARIYVTEKISARIKAAKEHGAVWAGNPDEQDVAGAILSQEPNGVDVALECAGQQNTLDEAVSVLRPGGVLALVGIPVFEKFSFSAEAIRRKEITIVNIRRQNRCDEKAIKLITSGRVKIDFMLTHRFELAEICKAFEIVESYRDGVIKAVIELS
ncbi:MAG: alcohol dehydrogenase catalytic domain-containing protein [Phycisphaerae bacterium]